MTKPFFYFAVIILALYSCDSTNVTITGTIKEGGNQKIYLEQLHVNRSIVVDSTKSNKAGEFTFHTKVETPTFFNIRIGGNELVTVIAEPNAHLKLSGTYQGFSQNYWVEDSHEHSLWIKLLNFQLHNTQVAMDSLKKSFDAIPQDEAHAQERLQITIAWDSIVRKQKEFSKNFILKHAISPAAYYALYQRFKNNTFILTPEQDLHSFRVVASSLKAIYPDTEYTKAILKHLEQIGKHIQQAQLKQLISDSENTLPELKLPNVHGDTVTLSSLKGKYIILDFTALYAKESQEYNEELKKVYQKFKHKGVVIYQVCFDIDPKVWKNLVTAYGIHWTCVRDESGSSSKLWNVQNLPANYIINPKYEIVGKNLRGKRLEERLTDLLK